MSNTNNYEDKPSNNTENTNDDDTNSENTNSEQDDENDYDTTTDSSSENVLGNESFVFAEFPKKSVKKTKIVELN